MIWGGGWVILARIKSSRASIIETVTPIAGGCLASSAGRFRIRGRERLASGGSEDNSLSPLSQGSFGQRFLVGETPCRPAFV